MPESDLIVLGLDPGSRCTGYGVVRERSGVVTLVDVGTVRPPSGAELAERLGYIYDGLSEVIQKCSPGEAALENVFVSKNASSALKLGQARGAALVACSVNRLPTAAYEPTVIKKTIVGVGRADKKQVAFMVGQILGVRPNWAADSSDALAAAICHLNQRRWQRMAV
ncbi:MAG: crossover junction endodeoxyribonuclease RuvC [Desulfovibrionales bacterium]